VGKAWSNIDVILKQRYEEIPKLVETCKAYMGYESGLLENITALRETAEKARKDGVIESLANSEGLLLQAMEALRIRAEAYPDLKASESFGRLSHRISTLEDIIADRREFYNDSVTLNNIKTEKFPDLLVARMFGFSKEKFFSITAELRADIDLGSLFDQE
jgi:LemA protein